jgi:anti-sigma factor RsiW
MGCPLGPDASRELAVSYTARSLDARAHAEFERHLRSCATCAEAVAEQQAVWEALDEWAPTEISAGFDQTLRERIAADQQSWRGRVQVWWQRAWRPAVPALAAGIVLGLAVWMNQPPQQEAAAPAKSSAQAPVSVVGQMDNLEHALDDMDMLGEWSAAVGSNSPI